MEIHHLLFGIIRNEIAGDAQAAVRRDELTEQECDSLYQLAKFHNLSHFIGKAWKDEAQGERQLEVYRYFSEAYNIAIMQYVRMTYELEQICLLFEQEQISFVPLKGSVLRNRYPDPSMRTSCDIDILIRESDMPKAQKLLAERFGCTEQAKGRHDVGFLFPDNVHLELHYSLIESDVIDKMENPLREVWEHVIPEEGKKYQCCLPDEFFYYYHIAHMAKHFVHGGCGISPFADIWILNHRVHFNSDKRSALLKSGGLLTFAQKAEKLAEIWFGTEAHDETTKRMERYVLAGGVYGTTQNRVVTENARSGNKFTYALSRVWFPYDILKYHYPSLENRRYLLPLYEIRRWFRIIFCGGLKKFKSECQAISEVTDNSSRVAEKMLNELGLNCCQT